MSIFTDRDGDYLEISPSIYDSTGITVAAVSPGISQTVTVVLTADQAGKLAVVIENYLSILEMSSGAGQEAATT